MLKNEKVPICKRDSINLSLNLYYCGYEECQPNQKWGPKVIDHFLLCYIVEGQGVLEVNHEKYQLHKGQGFLISPNILSSYQADSEHPWKLASIGFFGFKVERYLYRAHLTPENPIFICESDNFLESSFKKLIDLSHIKSNRYCKMMSILYTIMGYLIDISSWKDEMTDIEDHSDFYVRKALEFIDMNYSRKLSITDISDSIGLERKYFHHVFKTRFNISPQEYIIKYRMNKACQLMRNKSLTISDIARSVGYADQFHFSKIFKKNKGMSPSIYRKDIEKYKADDFLWT